MNDVIGATPTAFEGCLAVDFPCSDPIHYHRMVLDPSGAGARCAGQLTRPGRHACRGARTIDEGPSFARLGAERL